jgi:hypothetical protein
MSSERRLARSMGRNTQDPPARPFVILSAEDAKSIGRHLDWASGPECYHEWFVISTVLDEVSLMVQCANCEARGTVDDPTREEWSRAFSAPSNPYRWHDESRVRIRD